MVTGLNWTTYQQQMATLAVTSVSDPNFQSILAAMVDNAELRICQDLDLLANDQANSSFACTPASRQVAIPASTFVTIENINVITPAGTSSPNLGTRNPLSPTTKEVLDNLWPSSVGAGVPKRFAVFGQFNILMGPFPDLAYTLEVVGTTRPASLSASVTTTFISQNLPHLFIAASMVYISGYQRNFGRMNDDPQMAISWEGYYQKMMASSDIEEARKKFEGPAWTPKSPSKYAGPSRGPMPKAA